MQKKISIGELEIYAKKKKIVLVTCNFLKKENQTAPGVTDLSLSQLLICGMNCH